MRHAVVASPKEMERRWRPNNGVIFLQSSTEVYQDFLREAIGSQRCGAGSGHHGLDRRQERDDDAGQAQYQVEFVMETRNRTGKVVMSKAFVATLDVEWNEVVTATSNRLTNPTGFTVIGYRNVEKTS